MFAVVVACAFKDLPFLPIACASVDENTLKPSEKIVVTDGFDLSKKHELALNRAGWRVYSSKNKLGPGATRNLGAFSIHEKVKYIAFQDADDISHPSRFEFSIRKLERWGESTIVGCNAVRIGFHDKNRKLFVFGINKFRSMSKTIDSNKIKLGNEMIYATMCLSLERFKELGGFNESMYRGEDWELVLRLKSHGCSILNLKERLYAYQSKIFPSFRLFFADNIQREKRFVPLRYIFAVCKRLAFSFLISRSEKVFWRNLFLQIQTSALYLSFYGKGLKEDNT